MTENNKQVKFQVEGIKITSKKRGASKFFKTMYFIPAVIAGTVGTAGVIGSSVVSGIGLFEQKKIVDKVNNSANTNFETNFTKFTTTLKTKLTNTLKGVANISSKNVDAIMSDVTLTFFNAFKLPLSTISQAAIYQEVSTKAKDGTTTSADFISSFETFIGTTNKVAIQKGTQATAANIIFDLYGEKLSNGEYSKMQTWKIVFGVTTTVAGIMVLSALGYWFSRIDDHRKAKKNINVLKKIAQAADDKNVEYIIAKISNRYSID